MSDNYKRIVYPERAEYLIGETAFRGYRIFLDHWHEITNYLQEAFEVLATRRYSKALIIHGSQGCGKSVLATKIDGDFASTKDALKTGDQLNYDTNNIWHRITGGPTQRDQVENIKRATERTVVLQVENKRSWIEEAEKAVSGNADRNCLIIADNCERDYFMKGLLNVSDDIYLSTGRSESAIKVAANRFVELSRTTLRGCFFIFFTNDQDFALSFDQYVNLQHKGLVDIRDLKMPNELQKEAIVRINVNRLNPFSYWFCLDRAGPNEKSVVWRTLKSAETFPHSFAAVDNAIRSSGKARDGKPARKCMLNAFVFCNTSDTKTLLWSTGDTGDVEDIYVGQNFSVRLYRSGWSDLFGAKRDHKMLESEWNLKVILAGDAAVGALLGGAALAKRLVEEATKYHSPGTRMTTKTDYSNSLTQLDNDLASKYASFDNAAFWAKGSVRNSDYESKLKSLFPSYNTKGGGFLGARPDLVVDDYTPCSILSSTDGQQNNLNEAIRRDANVVEFTAIREFTLDKLVNYLRDKKLKNYIAAVQEQ